MKSKCPLFQILILSIVLSLITVESASAYLDPGAGSAILQGILAALVAIGLTLKLFWHKVLKMLGIRKSQNFEDKIDE